MTGAYKPQFGSVICGTLKITELIPALANELRHCTELDRDFHEKILLNDASCLEDYDSDEAYDILDTLMDTLTGYAPAYGYFGAHPDDGADFGYWLIPEWLQLMQDDAVYFTENLIDVPKDYTGDILVSDGRHYAFYFADNGIFTHEWSV